MRAPALPLRFVTMRDRETIASELRLIAAVRRSIREHGGEPSSRQVDELLDERLISSLFPRLGLVPRPRSTRRATPPAGSRAATPPAAWPDGRRLRSPPTARHNPVAATAITAITWSLPWPW